VSHIDTPTPAEDTVLAAITEWHGKDQLCAAWYAIGAARAALREGCAGEAAQILDHLVELQAASVARGGEVR
jgi:hypothetical protein